ncbi:MAG: hypothetical protein PUC33_05515, partial [Oscillospiraceae bacterium]|nr:hypothetical protein [Oscillospiraceae bacterium]
MKEKSKNTSRMKKIILSVLLLCLLVFSAYCIHYILTTASFNGAQYYNIPKKETVVGSETFICGDSLQDFPGWTVVVSRDMERDNEVFILEYASPPAFDILHVLNP